jgi:hypothetical protein
MMREKDHKTHIFCGLYIDDKTKNKQRETVYGRSGRNSWFPIGKRTATFLRILYRLLIFSCLVFQIVLTAISFNSCPHFAKLFYLTNWGVLLNLNFFLALNIQEVVYNVWSHNENLYAYVLGSHFVAFVFTLCIMVLYPMTVFFGGEFDTNFTSIGAHVVSPLLMIIVTLYSDMPWKLEYMYRISFFANLYLLFTAIHHKYKLSHLGHIYSDCPAAYAYYLNQQEYFVYKEVQYSNDLTLFFATFLILIGLPLLTFIIYFIISV